ncbi:MAG: hypothetical protein GY799_20575 [Desulfobulbaceae bacterium]|nr:hypothetical protein [Desulfobulbaceae bacterium]
MMGGKEIQGNESPPWPVTESGQSFEKQKELYQARPFLFSQSDLDLDFGEDFRPVLITQLLTSCLHRNNGTKFSEQEIWLWSLKQRLQGLLATVVSTLGQQLRLEVSCSKIDCHELMEVDLDLALFNQEEQATSILCRPDSETELVLRLPNGVDQLNWLSNQHDIADEWFTEMASSLVGRVNGETPGQDFRVSENWLDQIGTELEQHDDLMTLVINTSCPACCEDLAIDLDLEEKLLELLAGEQRLLLKQIHRLAFVYHWSEADIVAMPCKRRQYYLAQIDEE